MSRPPSALPEPYLRFLELFREGRFWDSHEALEDAWRATGSAFYQALILYASAFVHAERGNAHGVGAQLRKALRRLDGYPDAYLGLDVAALRTHCREAREVVESDPVGWAGRVEPLALDPSEDRVRGDEAEMERTPGPPA